MSLYSFKKAQSRKTKQRSNSGFRETKETWHTLILSPGVDPSLGGSSIKDNPNLFDNYHHHHQELLTLTQHSLCQAVYTQSGGITGTTDEIWIWTTDQVTVVISKLNFLILITVLCVRPNPYSSEIYTEVFKVKGCHP